jgi:hypothetical protein
VHTTSVHRSNQIHYSNSCRLLRLPCRYALVHYYTAHLFHVEYRTVRVLVWTYSTGLLPALFPCSILTLVYIICTARTYSTSYRSLSYVVPHPHVVSCHTVWTIRVPNLLYRRKRAPESCPIILTSGCFGSALRSSFFYSKCRLA